MPPEEETRQVNIRMPVELHERVNRLKEKTRRSAAQEMVLAIERHVDEAEAQEKKR